MRILSENSILERPGSWMSPAIRRVLSVSAGLGLGLGLLCAHARRPATTVVSEAPPSGAASASKSKPSPKPAARATWHQVGLASWYGREFQGKETASGETFNMNRLSCAHRSLPLGTWIKVTNLHNRKWVVLRVNDRGVARIRLDVIDSRQAAQVAHLEKLRIARQMADAPPSLPGY